MPVGSLAGAVFDFEDIAPDLPLLPIAARRALDRAGIKLSLAGWTSLPLESRRALVLAGAEDVVDPGRITELARAAEPAPRAFEALPEPNPGEPPEPIARAMGGSKEAARAWAALRPLERYALAHAERAAVKRGEPARLDEALRAIVSGLSTHLTARGEVRMVDVGQKAASARRAVAKGSVRMKPETLTRLVRQDVPKGEVLSAARVAGIMAAKRTPELIPLCHGIALTHVEIRFTIDEAASRVDVEAVAEAVDRTGVEMEALVAASVACLTVYDMLKGIDREMVISDVMLLEKSGGRSGRYVRGGAP